MNVEDYFNEWWTPSELPKGGFNKTAMLDFAEMYHKQALRQPPVMESVCDVQKWGETCTLTQSDKCCNQCSHYVKQTVS